jgi:hypothetical protein
MEAMKRADREEEQNVPEQFGLLPPWMSRASPEGVLPAQPSQFLQDYDKEELERMAESMGMRIDLGLDPAEQEDIGASKDFIIHSIIDKLGGDKERTIEEQYELRARTRPSRPSSMAMYPVAGSTPARRRLVSGAMRAIDPRDAVSDAARGAMELASRERARELKRTDSDGTESGSDYGGSLHTRQRQASEELSDDETESDYGGSLHTRQRQASEELSEDETESDYGSALDGRPYTRPGSNEIYRWMEAKWPKVKTWRGKRFTKRQPLYIEQSAGAVATEVGISGVVGVEDVEWLQSEIHKAPARWHPLFARYGSEGALIDAVARAIVDKGRYVTVTDDNNIGKTSVTKITVPADLDGPQFVMKVLPYTESGTKIYYMRPPSINNRKSTRKSFLENEFSLAEVREVASTYFPDDDIGRLEAATKTPQKFKKDLINKIMDYEKENAIGLVSHPTPAGRGGGGRRRRRRKTKRRKTKRRKTKRRKTKRRKNTPKTKRKKKNKRTKRR